MAIAVTTNIPYLFYTYSITHKPLYWGNSGGMSLYWMATLDNDELGDWHAITAYDYFDSTKLSYTEKYFSYKEKYILQNHQSDINYIIGVERDDAYKQLAIQNIKAHPAKYLRNCISNISRLLFNFPFTYDVQSEKMFFRVLPQCLLLTMMLAAFILTLWNWQKGLKSEIKFCFIFIIIYLSASTMVSAYQRHFYIIVPMIIFWAAYIFEHTLIIKLKKNKL
jgi:hypothetical protein